MSLIAMLLVSCGDGGRGARLDDYLTRLSRSLEATPVLREDAAPPSPPRWTALQLDIAGSSVDGLDFLKLRDCALQQTVARRNSSLGRMAPPSQRLLLDLDFLREVDPCIATLEARDEGELAALLGAAREQKRSQLPGLVFNATLGGEEFRDFWRAGRIPEDYPQETNSAVATALESIASAAERWLGGDYRADEEDFELALAEVIRGDGGELLGALAHQARLLDGGSALLRERRAQGLLCSAGLEPQAARILRTVARKYFIGSVQPDAAGLARREALLLPPIRALEARLAEVLPPGYRRWQHERDAALAAAAGAPKRHVRALQALLGDCYSEFRPAPAPAGKRAGNDSGGPQHHSGAGEKRWPPARQTG